MLNRILLTATLLLAAFTMACSQSPAPADAAAGSNRDADLKAIKDTETAWAAAAATKDAEKFISFYADDAVVLMPNAPAIKGKDAIRTTFKQMVADPNFSLTFGGTGSDVAKSGELGYSTGAYTLGMTDPKTKKPMTDKGKYLTAFKKQADGSWKAVADMINTDLPMAQ